MRYAARSPATYPDSTGAIPYPNARVLAARRFGAIVVAEAIHPPNDMLRLDPELAPTLSFVLTGEVKGKAGGALRTAGPDQALIRSARCVSPGVTGRQGAHVLHVAGIEPAASREWHRVGDARLAVLLLALRGELHRHDAGAIPACETLIGAVALALQERSRPSVPENSINSQWLGDAVRYLDAHSRTRLTAANLAAAVGVHRVTLSRGFRRCFDLTPGQYLRLVRLRDAMRSLVLGGQSAPQAAIGAGFYDQSHLIRWLRRETGTTPGRIAAEGGDPGPDLRSVAFVASTGSRCA